MKPVRILEVSFDMPLEQKDIYPFRGAFAAKVGLENEWFHNHNNAEDAKNAYHYRYSLIQYKIRRGQVLILFLEDCVEEAHRFFAQSDWNINFKGQVTSLQVKQLEVKESKVGVYDTFFTYSLRNWLPISKKEYKEFIKTDRYIDRLELLERKLNNHIIAFAKGVGCKWEGRIEAMITDLYWKGTIEFKKNRFIGFSLNFKSNFLLPDFVGIGRGISMGNGIVVMRK